MDQTDTTRGSTDSHSDWGIFGHDPSPFTRNDPNAHKPAKAAWGLGLLVIVSLVLYGVNAMHHSHAASMPTTASTPTSETGTPSYKNAHLAPHEDHSIQN